MAKLELLKQATPTPTPGAVQARMSRRTRALIAEMFADVREQLKALPWKDLQPVEVRQVQEVGDAAPLDGGDPFVTQAALLFDRLMGQWLSIFDREAAQVGGDMVQGVLKASDYHMGRTMRELGKQITLTPGPALVQRVTASAGEAAGLIKRVPAEFLPQIQGDVMRSITQGEGLKDLLPALKAREVKVKNWAENVARDQTRKTYATVNRTRAEEAGITKFRWIHSGGSNEPRKHHMARWPAGLNGGVFSFDDPPVIDPRTGERGFPAQAPYCGCIMQFVVELEEKQ